MERTITRHESRDQHGLLVVAYDRVDPTVPYYRKTWGEWRDEDAGVWDDLVVPTIPEWAQQVKDVTWVFDNLAGDGTARAALLDLGVTKAEWKGATAAERDAVVRALRAVQLLNEAVRAVIKNHDPRLRRTGTTALKKFADLVEKDAGPNNRKGHGYYRVRESSFEPARQLVRSIDQILTGAKVVPQIAQRDPLKKADWLGGIVDAINVIATMLSKSLRLLDACTVYDVTRVHRRTLTIEVARDITERVFPHVPREALGSGIRYRPNRNKAPKRKKRPDRR